MIVKFSSSAPLNESILQATGSIWGCVIQPLSNGNKEYQEYAVNVDRCKGCFAYINSYVTFQNGGWICNICLKKNPINYPDEYILNDPSQQQLIQQKYRYAVYDRSSLPEINLQSIELLVSNDIEQDVIDSTTATIDGKQAQQQEEIPISILPLTSNPIYIALIDCSGSKEQTDAIIGGLEALVHALPDNTLFGMIVFSHRIGVYNLHSTIPSIKFIEFDSFNHHKDLCLDDIIPLSKFLVPKSQFESKIISAIQSISSFSNNSGKKIRVCAMGSSIELLLDYLQVDERIPLHVKIGLFITGISNGHGTGSITKSFETLENLYSEYSKASFFKASTNFYKKQAERAIQLGAHFDLFCLGDTYFALDSIKFLSTDTGGNVFRYKDLSKTCTLPQDLYKLITSGWGFHGLLRIRTNKNFSVNNAYGSLFKDKQYDNLYHIESSSPFTCIAFDFKFTSQEGFEDDYPPNIQIAFSYSYLIPNTEDILSSSQSSSPLMTSSSSSIKQNNVRRIEKRLHIFNMVLPVVRSPADLFNSVDLETTISLLTHKAIRDSLERGLLITRNLLKEWLHNIIMRYNENVVILSSITSDLDITFSQVSHLRPLPRYVFALLKSQLLAELSTVNEANALAHRTDEWVFAQTQLSSLEPRLLHRAIYPVLNSYGAPNNLSSKYLALSVNTILTSTSHIYLLDSLDTMIVYYSDAVSPQHVFPAPSESLIRRAIYMAKQERLTTPSVIYCRGKLDETPQFRNYLIEEDSINGPSYYEFLHDISNTIKTYL
ncbi:hypothetical protein CYY_003343 [Polysphondylium violaceum]|uniref:Uncharacterized protein n=1 Tax=Polysphondylium violaceum TaxID=133409 RepID=A0A8J4PX62_9MYCE|nr:hypothetical protein CYY_003343 [Polysphondylium violaceum]